MTDHELASELKRFGEEIKLPIDRKKRPILIKKLNHYKAKENPPLKRSRSGGRQSKRSLAPAEFSDDSQDETEVEPISKRIFAGRKVNSPSTSTYLPSGRSLRNRSTDLSNSIATNTKSSRGKGTSNVNKKLTPARQIELYPEEFSDGDDTADESLYEVVNKSINTTFNFDSIENETEEDYEDLSPGPGREYRSGPYIPNFTVKLPSEKRNLISNHTSHGALNKGRKAGPNETVENREYSVSSTILTVVAVFFVALALSYAYIRRDIFLPHMAASLQSGTYM